MIIFWWVKKIPGPGCSKLGYDDPGLVRNLNSDLKAKKVNSVNSFCQQVGCSSK